MLTERFPAADLPSLLTPRERYHPYPTAADRDAWCGLPEAVRQAVVAAGRQHAGREWPSLPATLFAEYRRTGNRSHYEARHFERRTMLAALVLAECVEAEGRFLDDIADGVWAICEESFWGVPAHNGAPRFPLPALPDTSDPYIDLFAAETGGLLAHTVYLLGDRLDTVSPLVRDRLCREVKCRILDPYLARSDFWWMALDEDGRPAPEKRPNNWNPWCNSNCLAAALLVERDAGRRTEAVAKAMRSLDAFLGEYPRDGGCDEGTSYWDRAGGSLFDCLELLYGASDGRIALYHDPLIAGIGRYLYRSHIAGDWFINFADGGARVSISAALVYRYGRRIGDPALMALGADAYRRHGHSAGTALSTSTLMRAIPALFTAAEMDAAPADPPLVRDVWLPDTQVMAARERGGSADGLYVAAKGGHNGESHNHNDVGQFVVYCDGEPVIVDAGVETYTAKTFSAQRYDIWTMQSAFHNLPTVGGVQQAPGAEFAARDVAYQTGDDDARLSLDIAAAYPPEAGIRTWHRTVALERGARAAVTVTDRFELERPSEVTVTLMTARAPRVVPGEGILLPGRRTVLVAYPEQELAAEAETIELADEHLQSVWGTRLYRVLLRSRQPVQHGEWTLRIGVAAQVA